MAGKLRTTVSLAEREEFVSKTATNEKPLALPSSGSLSSSTLIGLSPSVYSRRRAIVLYRESLDGRFSWNRSPASKMKSTCAEVSLIGNRENESLRFFLLREISQIPSFP